MIKKKNIILYDRSAKISKELVDNDFCNVHTMIVDQEFQKKELEHSKTFENIYYALGEEGFFDECLKQKDINLSYDDIKEFRSTQIKVEKFLSRFSDDINLIQYMYFNALSFWLDIFRNNCIDLVLWNDPQHGTTMDIALDVAKKFNITVLINEVILGVNGEFLALSIFDYGKKEYIDLSRLTHNFTMINVNKYLFTSTQPGAKDIEPESKGVKQLIKKILFSIGGFISVSFVLNLLGKFNMKHYGLSASWFKVLNNFLSLRKVLKYYGNIAVKPNTKNKYIYYPLHFDPEASTMNKTILHNQLTIAKIIAQNLPDDTFLFIKEHPHYAKLNKEQTSFYFMSIGKYRTKNFYEELLKLKNVKLIKKDFSSSNLIKNAIAVASINGTALFESMVKFKKPVLFFGYKTSPFSKSMDTFKIESSNDCKNAIIDINNGVTPRYNDIHNIIKKFMFEVDLASDIILTTEQLRELITSKYKGKH